jgi:hypothetical protein
LVVAVGVEGQVVEEFAGFGEDSDVEVVDQHDDSLAGVGASEADVVEAAVVSQGD